MTAQVATGTLPTIEATFTDADELPADLDAPPTVTVVADDGTARVTAAATTNADGLGRYTYVLPASATVRPDLLHCTWQGTRGGSAVQVATQAEVVGAQLFPLAQLRQMPNLGDAQTYPVERLAVARAWVDDRLRRHLGTSVTPRWRKAVGTAATMAQELPEGGEALVVADRYAHTLQAVHFDGVALSGGALAQLVLRRPGLLTTVTGVDTWPAPDDWTTVVVRYVAGAFDQCPTDLQEACLTAARARLLRRDGASGIPGNATSMTNEFGNIRLAQPSEDEPTGIPEVDSVWNAYRRDLRLAGL